MKIIYPTITLVYDQHRRGSRERAAAVEIRVSYQRRRVFLSTGVKVCPHQWSNGKVKSVPNADIINERLHSLLANTEARVRLMWEAGDFNLDDLRTQRNSEGGGNPFPWIQQEMMRRPIREITRRLQFTALEALRRCELFRRWRDFTPQNMAKWTEWLKENTGAKCESSIHNYHKRIKPYLKKALFEGILKSDPYAGYSVPRGESNTLKYLETWERDAIMAAELDGTAAKVRDVFVFCCYTGLAWCDVANLNADSIVHENGHAYVQGCRQKTGTPYRNLLLDAPMKILQRYNYKLPVLSNQKMNAWLKVVAAKAGIRKNLTTHMARHTFGTWTVNHGVPIEIVSKMMGHRSIKETQIYAKITQGSVDAAFASLSGK